LSYEYEPHIESLLTRLASSSGGPLRPVSGETPDHWPALVVNSAAGRVDAIGQWLSAHADLGVDDPALRLAIIVMLSELGLMASFIRVTTSGALHQLDQVDESLRHVRHALDDRANDAADAASSK